MNRLTSAGLKLDWFSEPTLKFAHDQDLEDPRDGLTIFGPLSEGKPFGIRAGVVGTGNGLALFRIWLNSIQSHVLTPSDTATARPHFPGFEAVFKTPWRTDNLVELEVNQMELSRAIHLEDKHQRVFNTVGIYTSLIESYLQHEETTVDIWMIVIPDEVYQLCRPKSSVPKAERIVTDIVLTPKLASQFESTPSLFQEENEVAVAYRYEVNFHNQLKARLLFKEAPTQIVRESTLSYKSVVNKWGNPLRDLEGQESAIAWTLSTQAFYKCGGKPWKLSKLRPGVCYLGMVFKEDLRSADPAHSCCAAQMFMDSGDGTVFRGALGPWKNVKTGEFHISGAAAEDIVAKAIAAYKAKAGSPPKEIFLHGRSYLNAEEWGGFSRAVDSGMELTHIRIRDDTDLRFYRADRKNPVLRGTAITLSDHSAMLWTKGYIPRLRTYIGREVPRPLFVEITKGDAEIPTVLSDILNLTKLNYNTCAHSDGKPVTLKFADAVGEILTAGPLERDPPLPFKYYI